MRPVRTRLTKPVASRDATRQENRAATGAAYMSPPRPGWPSGLSPGWFYTWVFHRDPGQDIGWCLYRRPGLFDGNLPLIFDGEAADRGAEPAALPLGWRSPLNLHPWVYPPTFLLLFLPFGCCRRRCRSRVSAESGSPRLVRRRRGIRRTRRGRAIVLFSLLLCPAVPFNVMTGQNAFFVGALLLGGFGAAGTVAAGRPGMRARGADVQAAIVADGAGRAGRGAAVARAAPRCGDRSAARAADSSRWSGWRSGAAGLR